jgi:hypothetical protein
MAIPGISIDAACENRIWSAFTGWADHFLTDLENGGVMLLVRQYAAVVDSVESQSCTHGPGGTRLAGAEWQYCCGISYEYLNDIAVRDALQVILDTVPPEQTRTLRDDVAKLDDRLYSRYADRPPRVGSWWQTLPDGVLP